MGIEYTREKMNQLIHGLAEGIPALPERLEVAYPPLSSAINDAMVEGHLPEEILRRLQEVESRMTRVATTDNEASLQATLRTMSTPEAQEIAFDLVELAWEIDILNENDLEEPA